MRKIVPHKIKRAVVAVPGSKSYTHRMLIAAALSDGRCLIRNCLDSEDTRFTIRALRQLGVRIDAKDDTWVIHGRNGRLDPSDSPIFLGNSGTSMRLLTALVALGRGTYTLTGSARMHQRPIRDLIDGLNQIGVRARSLNDDGCPPVEVPGNPVEGGAITLNCSTSSQYLSALLLIAPCTEKGLKITVSNGPVSRPYVDITLDVMQTFGIDVRRIDYDFFEVQGKQIYRAGNRRVEPDGSQAGYFWAAAAVTGATIKVKGISDDSCQGDIRFVALLEKMGCTVTADAGGIIVRGGRLEGITADMADMPDMVPTMAVVAAFAKGETVMKNVAHLRAKESDRLAAVAKELQKMGIDTVCSDNALTVKGGQPHGAEIETYGDHRIAMSFALAGLKIPGIVIKDESCVEKSFPDFWQVFEGLYH